MEHSTGSGKVNRSSSRKRRRNPPQGEKKPYISTLGTKNTIVPATTGSNKARFPSTGFAVTRLQTKHRSLCPLRASDL